ncbi:glycosyltransferase [Candidatus Arthromitus sp. SFB-rat-Yit]|uniref:glycosyltransferase n=1 Tax=Candidatus Arthromitus sp. SFB-rat-Yit TaxID=1041504 RepID=UPI000227A642|nr:glycosyltransferase [Candidatus Arthromitus sp. SFB-rat-Yit]BAK80608.1 glycosyltransferase [Candidatus Arthromitus sp. SFB-rat-Yit]
MNIALVHDWLPFMGGAERVITNFLELFKNAPIYTSVYNKDRLEGILKDANIYGSFLQKFRSARKDHRKFLPLMPTAFETFDLNKYDVVLSSSSSCAKGIVTNPNTCHICYCHSPMRYGWEFYYEYIENSGKFKRFITKYIMNYMRIWDNVSSDRVDYFIANSKNVANRIWKHYRRDSVVIHPPVRSRFFEVCDKKQDYFLIVSRLQEYKKVDLAIEVFNELNMPLIIIGEGPLKEKLVKKVKHDNIKFLGRQSDDVVKKYYREARAFLFPGEEDFGITSLEAQCSGTPVIAYGKGGALETVVHEKTGLFFYDQTISSLKSAINEFCKMEFNSEEIRVHAEKFDEEIFKFKISNFVYDKVEEFKNNKKWIVL